MDFKEFVNKLEQDLKDAMADISPGATVDVRSVEKLQEGSYTGITISPAGGNVGMNLNANQLFDTIRDQYDFILVDCIHQKKKHCSCCDYRR